MQVVNSNILIEKADGYLKDNTALLENEIISLMLKKDIICNEFNLSLDNLKECSVTQKFYSRFFVIEVRNSDSNLVGFKLVTDNNEIYQVSSFEKKEVQGKITVKEEFIIDDFELKLLVGIQKNNDGHEDVFTIMPNTSLDSCYDLRETAEVKIFQAIEKMLGQDEMKIYQIRRKEPVIPKISHNLDNVISYDEKKKIKTIGTKGF